VPNRAYDFDIKVAGEPLSETAKRHLSSLAYEENLERTAWLEFTVRASESYSVERFHQVESSRASWLWDKPSKEPEGARTLKLGQPVEFRLGLLNALTLVFTGEIISIAPEFPHEDPSSLRITAYDKSYKLKRKPEPTMFSPEDHPNYESIVRHIINKHGLKLKAGKLERRVAASEEKAEPSMVEQIMETVEGVTEKAYGAVADLLGFKLTDDQCIVQIDKTDWEILSEIAKQVNFNLFVKYDYLFLIPDSQLNSEGFHGLMDPDRPFTKLNMIYRPIPAQLDVAGNVVLRDFQPEIGSEGQREQVEIISWDVFDKEGQKVATEKLPDATKKSQNYTVVTVKTHAIETLRIPGTARNKGQAITLVRAELERRAARLVEGNGVLANGNPHIRMGQRHNVVLQDLQPFGKQFSGEYLISAVRHEIDSEGICRTSFDVRKDGLTPV
jgi:hypothetical protein